jgi:phage terminase large subunit GpA-like protein
MQAIEQLLDVFRRSSRPPARLSPSEWSSGRVVIQDGLTPKFQIENAPWQREPLDVLANADAKEVVFLAPIGTGKTTFMEAGLAYIFSEDPGPTLIVGQTDDDLKDWAETRMDFMIRNTPETALLMPHDRHKKRKMQILSAAMSLFLTGANLSGLQSKSMRRVFCDEAWQYKPGMLNEARGRLHDRWNRQMFLMSQAGVKNDDLDKAWEKTDRREFCFPCPTCGTIQPWKWCNVVGYDDESQDDLTRAQSARMKCDNADCDWICEDNAQQRRALAESASYVPTAVAMPGRVGFHYNVLCNWRLPLWEIVLLWLEAKAAMRVGNLDPLRQFIQKRLAEPWEEDLTDNRTELVGDGYTLAEYSDGKLIEDECVINGTRMRFLTIDCQGDHFWYVIRAWRANGESMKIAFGRIEGLYEAEQIAEKYKISPKMVFVDSGFGGKDFVYSACARRDWTALKGSAIESFPWKRKDGKIVMRPYQRFGKAIALDGTSCRFANWSSDRIKDIVFAYRTGKGPAWMLPDDVSPEYIKQIDSERKEEVINAKTRQSQYIWKKFRKDNHAWDCEAMQIVAAMIMKLIPGFDV